MIPRHPDIEAAFDAAQALISETAGTAVAEAVAELLPLIRSAPTYRERNRLATAQTLLLQGRDMLVKAFRSALGEALAADLIREDHTPARDTDWQAVCLVDDEQIDDRISFERIGQFIGQECEAELRELTALTSSMLGHRWADPARNPLRGVVIGTALHHAIDALGTDSATLGILAKAIGQPLAKGMPACYRAIIADLEQRGVARAELAVRPAAATPPAAAAAALLEEARRQWERSRTIRPDDAADTLRSWESSILGRHGHIDSVPDSFDSESSAGLLERLIRGGLPGSAPGRTFAAPGARSAEADAELLHLLRRLNGGDTVRDDLDSQSGPAPTGSDAETLLARQRRAAAPGTGGALDGLMAANLIRLHRETLQQATQGKLDHLMIDVVSSLFDQILSDPRVAPHMAREIARLQLPVLRIALQDASFFASRRHPVRRFINRVSSLATGLGDFEAERQRELLSRVHELVTDIVDGDFDQIEVYNDKLVSLEAFAAEQARAEVRASAAGATLAAKELEWQRQQRFSATLRDGLQPLALPAYLNEFLAQVWAQVIFVASQADGDESSAATRFRRAGVDLVVSIQPKRSPEQRAYFLQTLSALMATLNQGMSLIDWPQASRREFLGKLIAAHAGSLKGAPATDLDYNMMLRQLAAAFKTALPGAADLGDKPIAAAPTALVEQRFSAEEAQQVGLLDESAVDWASPAVAPAEEARPAAALEDVDLPLDDPRAPAGPAADTGSTPLPPPTGLPGEAGPSFAALPGAAGEPTEGPRLRDHLQIGVSYQLHLKDHWEKVRLSYMSPARNLFLFTHGSKDRASISMTARMLERLCDSRRMRTFEPGFLIDRATERARRQLAELSAKTGPRLH
ncbi:MAG: DUF1631 family protein [Caldimonas sp.]